MLYRFLISSKLRNYSGSRKEVQLFADKSFGQPEKKLNFWLSSYKIALQQEMQSRHYNSPYAARRIRRSTFYLF
jgi:hypothetical protein